MGRYGRGVDAHPCGLQDRVADGRRWGAGRRFAKRFGPEGTGRFRVLHKKGLETGMVHKGGEFIQAQIIAGGTDVLVQMREGRRAGAELISIYGICGHPFHPSAQ